MTLKDLLDLLALIFRKDKSNLTHWAQAFMTTGAAMIATAFFSDHLFTGAIIGALLILISVILNAKGSEKP